MDRRVASCALCLGHVRLIMPAGNTRRQLVADAGMALEAKLPDLRTLQHFRIGRSVRCMARRAAFQLYRTVFEHERALFI